ncbi:MAG: class I SAM-dependent methyltransferase [Parachlamydia sp.]|jgi:SAM-dependent methyltransferase|nr:class I SAM-dependent methyltransferase [Parachlamydia sp.]
MKKTTTSWNKVGGWYNDTVGEQGHYYHQAIIIPNVMRMLDTAKQPGALLDIACGQGILSRHLPQDFSYFGVDISPRLIKAAEQYTKSQKHQFAVGDATMPLPTKRCDFTHGAIILALQNIEFPKKVFEQAYKHLLPGSPFIIVLNHPYFRIPRQSSWQIDQEKKLQFRRIDRYMSDLKIPIQMHPGKNEGETTWSFHHPLSSYTKWLHETGFSIDYLEEWCSDKVSEGKAAKMENRSRAEFPLFMVLAARKKG